MRQLRRSGDWPPYRSHPLQGGQSSARRPPEVTRSTRDYDIHKEEKHE